GPLETRLKQLLEDPRVSDALLALPGASAAPALPPEMAAFFQQDASGKYWVPEQQKAAAKQHLEKAEPIVRAADDAAARLANLAQRVQPDSDPARRYQAALRDPLLSALMVAKLTEAGRSPADLPQAAEEEAKKALRQ